MITSGFGLFYCYSTSSHFVRHVEALLEKEYSPLYHLQDSILWTQFYDFQDEATCEEKVSEEGDNDLVDGEGGDQGDTCTGLAGLVGLRFSRRCFNSFRIVLICLQTIFIASKRARGRQL